MPKIVLIAMTAVLVIAGVAAASIVYQPGGSGSEMQGPDAVSWDGTPPTIAVSVSDPAGRKRWALRQYRSKAGLPCLEVGRLKGEDPDVADFGRVNDDGTFEALPIDDGGSAVDLSESSHALLVDRYPATDVHPAQAAIFGMAARDVRSVILHAVSGDTTIPVVNGVFLDIQSEASVLDASVEFVDADGSSATYDLRAHAPLGSSGP